MAKELTPQQHKFIVEYLDDGNGTRAAKAAGYAEVNAAAQASNLLRNPKVKAEIAAIMRDRAMPAEEVIARLSDQARADFGDVLDENGFIDLTSAKKLRRTRFIRKVTQTQTTDGETISTTTSVEMVDSQKALITLAKYHGLLIDRVQVSTGDVQEQVIAEIKKGTIAYPVLKDELGDSLAADLFRRAGVPIDAAR